MPDHPDTPNDPPSAEDQALEARLVAMVLGEASDFEKTELEKVIETRPALAAFTRRIAALHRIGEEALAPMTQADPWKLAPERRAALLERFGAHEKADAPPTSEQKTNRVVIPLFLKIALPVAALILLGFLLPSTFPLFQKESVTSIAMGVPGEMEYFSETEQSSESDLDSVTVSNTSQRPSTAPGRNAPADGARKAPLNTRGLANRVAPAPPAEPNPTDSETLEDNIKRSGKVAPLTGSASNVEFFGVTQEEIAARQPNAKAEDEAQDDRIAAPVPTSSPFGFPSAAISKPTMAPERVDRLREEAKESSRRRAAPKPSRDQEKVARTEKKLDETVLPQVKLKDATIDEALNYLYAESRRLDPEGQGIKMKTAEGRGGSIDLDLTNVPLGEALRYVSDLSQTKYLVEEDSVVVVPQSSSVENLITQEIEVPTDFLPRTTDGTSLEVQEYFESLGIAFPEGSAVVYLPEEGKIIVKNTQSNLDLVTATVGVSTERVESVEQGPIFATTPQSEPFSTFSLHVADVAFQLAAESLLEQNTLPEPSNIRPEEFTAAFDYGDPSPAPGEPVALAQDQSVHPFLQSSNLLRLSVRTAAEGRSQGQPINLILLLDKSGSMERADRATATENAIQALGQELNANDLVTLVTFDRQASMVTDRTAGNKAIEPLIRAQKTYGDSGTNLQLAMATVNEIAAQRFIPGAINRVLLITDGIANLGEIVPTRLAREVETLRNGGFAFDVVAVGGSGVGDSVLETMARDGDGRYFLLTDGRADAGRFAKKLAGAFRPAARNVKVQVQFNPRRVDAYSLLGFEEHRLNKEDFRDDSVDAAEMAAAEQGTALYQLEVNPAGAGEIGQVSIRFQDTDSGQMIERTWTIPYYPATPPLDKAGAPHQLAVVATLFAESLRRTPTGSLVDLEQLEALMPDIRHRFNGDPDVLRLDEMITKAQAFH